MSIPHRTTQFTSKPACRPTREHVEPYEMTTATNWGSTARVSAVERIDGCTRVTLVDSTGRTHQTELNVTPDPEGACKVLGEWWPLAVLVVARGQVLECGVVASGGGSSGRVDVNAAQALGLVERGVQCVFRR